jgi:hypothetical protein
MIPYNHLYVILQDHIFIKLLFMHMVPSILWNVRLDPRFPHRAWMVHKVSNSLNLPACVEVDYVCKHCCLPFPTL